MLITLPVVLALLALLVLGFFAWKWSRNCDHWRDPVNIKVLRGSGEGLREQLQ